MCTVLRLSVQVRKANKIASRAEPQEVVLDDESRIGFEVRYSNGQVAEVAWAFVRELPPGFPLPRKS